MNDLIDKEDPSKMIKQVILDMENQLLQVKTQVAISIADQHMLEKKEKENDVKAAEWLHKAELAVDRGQDDLARAALERQKGSERTAESFRQQVADQRAQVATLKGALGKASDARIAIGSRSTVRTFERMKEKVIRHEAVSQAKSELVGDDLDDRFAQLERDDEVDRLLTDLKAKRGATA